MVMLLLSLGLAVGLLAVTMPLPAEYVTGSGGLPIQYVGQPPPEPFVLMTHALTLPHFIIGDFFYWSGFPKQRPGEKRVSLLLAGIGVALFTFLRHSAVYPGFFYVYFLAHFWKDIDLDFPQPQPGHTVAMRRHPKFWSGLFVCVAFGILSSGLIRDEALIALAKPWVLVGAVLLAALAAGRWLQAHGRPEVLDVLWMRFGMLGASLLLLFTWIDVSHPLNLGLRKYFGLAHLIHWYVFYAARVRQVSAAAQPRAQGWLNQLKQSPAGVNTVIILVNAVSLLGAVVYVWAARSHGLLYRLLTFVYDPGYQYLLGCWGILHITCNWPAKEVKGVKVGY